MNVPRWVPRSVPRTAMRSPSANAPTGVTGTGNGSHTAAVLDEVENMNVGIVTLRYGRASDGYGPGMWTGVAVLIVLVVVIVASELVRAHCVRALGPPRDGQLHHASDGRPTNLTLTERATAL
jgi:hypothetical protein